MHINHCFVGGGILVRLIESIIESNERPLPQTDIYKGIIYGLYGIKNIFNIGTINIIILVRIL